jgi:hypothetical protein
MSVFSFFPEKVFVEWKKLRNFAAENGVEEMWS